MFGADYPNSTLTPVERQLGIARNCAFQNEMFDDPHGPWRQYANLLEPLGWASVNLALLETVGSLGQMTVDQAVHSFMFYHRKDMLNWKHYNFVGTFCTIIASVETRLRHPSYARMHGQVRPAVVEELRLALSALRADPRTERPHIHAQ